MKNSTNRANAWKASCTLIATALAAGGVHAHHSFSMFDGQKYVVLQGTIAEFQWINPHAFVELDVPTKSGTVRYSIETSNPGMLKPLGWKRSSLKPGDKVTVGIYPLRNGEPGGTLVEVTFPDGRKLDTGTKGYIK